jgi:hypothetical protein
MRRRPKHSHKYTAILWHALLGSWGCYLLYALDTRAALIGYMLPEAAPLIRTADQRLAVYGILYACAAALYAMRRRALVLALALHVPLQTLSIITHEAGHGMAAVLSGGTLIGIGIDPPYALYRSSRHLLVIPAGLVAQLALPHLLRCSIETRSALVGPLLLVAAHARDGATLRAFVYLIVALHLPKGLLLDAIIMGTSVVGAAHSIGHLIFLDAPANDIVKLARYLGWDPLLCTTAFAVAGIAGALRVW